MTADEFLVANRELEKRFSKEPPMWVVIWHQKSFTHSCLLVALTVVFGFKKQTIFGMFGDGARDHKIFIGTEDICKSKLSRCASIACQDHVRELQAVPLKGDQ